MEAPAWFFTKALSHRQKVLRLFKKAMRTCDHWFMPDCLEMRYQKVIVRARFDLYKNELDMRKAKLMLVDGVKELWEKQHPNPFLCKLKLIIVIIRLSFSCQFLVPYDPHGPAANRSVPAPDAVNKLRCFLLPLTCQCFKNFESSISLCK